MNKTSTRLVRRLSATLPPLTKIGSPVLSACSSKLRISASERLTERSAWMGGKMRLKTSLFARTPLYPSAKR